MKMNIGRGGRWIRAITGTLCVFVGVAGLWLGWPESAGVRWVVGVVLIAVGVFQWYEARKGWCVARACGIRTPL